MLHNKNHNLLLHMMQADVAENVKKQAQLMGVISQNQAAYKQVFGYNEWRSACEVPSSPHHPLLVPSSYQ